MRQERGGVTEKGEGSGNKSEVGGRSQESESGNLHSHGHMTHCVWAIRKLQSQSAALRAELLRLFGEEVQFEMEAEPLAPPPDQGMVIALGVLLALSLLALIVTVALVVRSDR